MRNAIRARGSAVHLFTEQRCQRILNGVRDVIAASSDPEQVANRSKSESKKPRKKPKPPVDVGSDCGQPSDAPAVGFAPVGVARNVRGDFVLSGAVSGGLDSDIAISNSKVEPIIKPTSGCSTRCNTWDVSVNSTIKGSSSGGASPVLESASASFDCAKPCVWCGGRVFWSDPSSRRQS